MKQKTKLPPNIVLSDDLSPLGRVREVTKRLLAVRKEVSKPNPRKVSREKG